MAKKMKYDVKKGGKEWQESMKKGRMSLKSVGKNEGENMYISRDSGDQRA